MFAPSLRKVAHVEKEKENVPAAVRYAWYLGVCGYCSEAWILFCVWWWLPMLQCSGLYPVQNWVQNLALEAETAITQLPAIER